MASFRDEQGREWKVRLTVGSVAEVLRETKVNLALAAKDSAWVDAIFGDPGKLVEILWALCGPQAKGHGVATPEEFAGLFDGATLEQAGSALAEGVADFFPRSRIAKALRETWAKTITAAEDKVIERLAATSTASPSPTNSPGSSGSIPAG